VQIPGGGTTLFVRTAIVQDAADEGDQLFTLSATNTGGTSGTGTGTIDDHGGGNKYPPADPPVGGPPPTGTGTFDDDRPLTVSSIIVNEGSPYAVFTITGAVDQYARLTLNDGTAVADTNSSRNTDGSDDYGPSLQYWNGTAWTNYPANSFVQIPGGGTTLLVRTAIVPDLQDEGDHAFTLSATNSGGTSGTGSATINDHGGGIKYPDATPLPDGTPITDGMQLDDDRPLTVSSRTFNEASPYAVFTVTGAPSQLVILSLGNTESLADKDATLGVDTANAGAGVPGCRYSISTARLGWTMFPAARSRFPHRALRFWCALPSSTTAFTKPKKHSACWPPAPTVRCRRA
jgi:hypothetical protein